MAVMAQSPDEVAKGIRRLLSLEDTRGDYYVKIGDKKIGYMQRDKRNRSIPTFNHWRTTCEVVLYPRETYHQTTDGALDYIALKLAEVFLMIEPWSEGVIAFDESL
jgi:hypothetical protein